MPAPRRLRKPSTVPDTSLPAPPLGPCACSRLRRAARAITQLYDDALLPSGLKSTQFGLLRTLERRESLTISALAAEMLLDRTALSRNLEPLVERGLVAIATGNDLRTRRVTMSPEGRHLLESAERHWAQAQREVSRRLGRQRLADLYGLLDDVERLHPGLPGSKESQ